MRHLALSTLGVLTLLLSLFSCSKEDTTTETIREDYLGFKQEGLAPHFGTDQFNDAVFVLGGLKDRDKPWIRARAGKNLCTDVSAAKIIVLGNSIVDANVKLLASAYEEGKIVIVCNPDLDKLRKLRSTYGWHFIIPEEKPEYDFAIGFARHHSILLKAPVFIKGDVKAGSGAEEVYENTSVFFSARALVQFIKQYKQHQSNQTKASINVTGLDEKINTLYYSVTRDYSYCTTCRRNLKIFASFAINYSAYPCYLPEGVNNHGDYYQVKATFSNFAPTMYEYDTDPNVPVGKYTFAHYWPYNDGAKEKSFTGDAYFLGPYNACLVFKCYSTSGQLKLTERPIPGTDISTVNYSESSTKSWNVGISGGYGQETGATGSINVGFGGSKTNSVSYSMSDLRVVNNSDNNAVGYEFNYQNIPNVDSDFDSYLEKSKMPAICRSTADFDMAWEWATITPKNDYDATVFDMQTEVKQSVCVMVRDKVSGSWTNYSTGSTHTFTFTTSDSGSLLEVARIPVGCLRLDNKCSGNQLLYDITIVNESGETVLKTDNNLSPGEYYEVLLPRKNHTYSVYFNMGDGQSSAKPYYSIDSKIALPLLDTQGNKRILSATETGGDFETNQAKIKVKNQSMTKLVRNLGVYKADDNTLVVKYPNSLGFFESAEMYVTAGVKYYIKMEFGSSSDFSTYRTGADFIPAPYHSDSDTKILYMTDEGGDFVKQI